MYRTNQDTPKNHKELADLIYTDKTWKKSKRYRELHLDLSDRLKGRKLNALPPKIVYEILSEELEQHSNDKEESVDKVSHTRFTLLTNTLKKYRILSEREISIKMRALRIWFCSGMDSDFDKK